MVYTRSTMFEFCAIYVIVNIGVFNSELIEFEPMQRFLVHDSSPISSTSAVSVLHCGALCHETLGCQSFAFDCGLIYFTMTSGECHLYDEYVTSTADLISSSLCYIQRKIPGVILSIVTTTSAAPPTTSPTLTTSTTLTTTISTLAGQIRGLVEGDFGLCTSRDFLLITDSGVYVYDAISKLMTGSCSGPTPLSTMFPGFSSIPAATAVECVMIYQSDIEMYSGGTVYIWQNNGNGFGWRQSRSYQNHLDTDARDALTAGKIVWCTGRTKNNVERHFYMDTGNHVVYDSQMRTVTHGKNAVIRYNNFNINPWSDIPNGIIASTGYTSQFDENFVLVGTNLTVYSYALNHSPDNNNPTKTVTIQGYNHPYNHPEAIPEWS